MSTSRHSQSHESKEIMSSLIGSYLRCFCAQNQRELDGLMTPAERAYSSANVKIMGMSLFGADIGLNPRSPLDLLTGSRDLNKQSVRDFRKCLKLSLEDAAFPLWLEQARRVAYNARKYKPATYPVRDEIFLSEKIFTTAAANAQLSVKLGMQHHGPFWIL